MTDSDFAAVVEQLQTMKDKHGSRLNMKSVMVTAEGATYRHVFDDRVPRADVRSISKVAVSMAVGVAGARDIAFGDDSLTLDSKVWPFFVDRFDSRSADEVDSKWADVSLRHLLTNTIGHREGFLFRRDIGDRDKDRLLEYIFEARLDYAPGSYFSYSNIGPYLISAIVQDTFGVTLEEWVGDLLFKPLRIQNYSWSKYGRYTAGCSGLVLSDSDLHKLGLALLHDGKYEGTRAVPSEWVNTMRSPLVLSPEKYDSARVFPKYAYGLGLWVTENGTYYCDGTGGQYLIVIPSRQLVITTQGDQDDMKPITLAMKALVE